MLSSESPMSPRHRLRNWDQAPVWGGAAQAALDGAALDGGRCIQGRSADSNNASSQSTRLPWYDN
eukprot:CAMPEP_0180603906 /NCGR_PEP_ID=MMETSP1037_2-20121125/25762_1 /TAXON_ID=632150 /ORGANISM="Azadinium spinosum, Strain 3D9" /LENGTH=64 /DNA_ID=CAMNT_0022622841 /DNA_START=557 /DNA_END=751 /DNA_ORIENTATION=-